MTDLTKKSEQECSSKLNRTHLKYIAIVAMLLDHIGMVFGQYFMDSVAGAIVYNCFRVLGRLTAPIMCFFLSQGFLYTRSRKKYAIRLAVFAVISQVPYALAHHHSLLEPDFNMLFVLLICFGMLCVWESKLAAFPKTLVLLVLICLSAFCDWGLFAPLLVLFFHVFRENRRKIIISYSILVVVVVAVSCVFLVSKGLMWYRELWQLGLFLFIPVLFLYNGQPGLQNAFNKWFFYIFYPAHLLILWAIYSMNM